MAQSKDEGADKAVKADAPASKPAAKKAPAAKKPATAKAAAKPARKPRRKAAVAKSAVAKAPAKTPAKKAASKPAAKKPAAKPATPKAAVAKTVAPTPAIPAVVAKTAKTTTKITEEFIKMTTPEEMTKGFKTAMADATAKSKEAYEKGTAMFADASEFTKGNVEAMVESSKIFASGMQEMGRSFVADSKAEFESLTGEVKELAAVKSPTDFFQLQSAMMRKYFDKSVAAASKNTEAMLKLANDAAQPLSSRVSVAMEKIKAV